MVNPLEDLNKAMRDQEARFTKREMMAMHLTAALITHSETYNLAETIDIAINAADALLERLRLKR